jgi:hypothetical protein
MMAMNKKSGILLTGFWVATALFCSEAHGQETSPAQETNSQDTSSVDASAHAEVEDGAKQQQPPPRQPRRPVAYSKWGFPSASPTSANRFGSARAATAGVGQSPNVDQPSALNGPAAQAEKQTGDRSNDLGFRAAKDGNPSKGLSPFGSSPADRQHGHSLGSQLSAVPIESIGGQPEPAATPFRGKSLGGIGTTSFSNPFPKTTYSSAQSSSVKDRAKSKNHKAVSKKTGEKPRAGTSAGLLSERGNKVGSQVSGKSHQE